MEEKQPMGMSDTPDNAVTVNSSVSAPQGENTPPEKKKGEAQEASAGMYTYRWTYGEQTAFDKKSK